MKDPVPKFIVLQAKDIQAFLPPNQSIHQLRRRFTQWRSKVKLGRGENFTIYHCAQVMGIETKIAVEMLNQFIERKSAR